MCVLDSDGEKLPDSKTRSIVGQMRSHYSKGPLMSLLPSAVIDLETTGFRPSDRVVEIGVVLMDHDLVEEGTWETLIQPDRDIDNAHVHGITATDLVRAPRFSGIAKELAELLSGRVLIAHNAPFDTRFLVGEFARVGVDLPSPSAWSQCTQRLSRELLPGSPERLSAALDVLGLKNSRPHAALSDALATADLYREIITNYAASNHHLEGLLLPTPLLAGDASVMPEKVVIRGEEEAGAAGWLQRLADHIPDTGLIEVDGYRQTLRASLIDGQLSVSEVEQLINTAEQLGISRDEASEIHGDYLRQLAVEAWADGVVTPDERQSMHDIAVQLGVDAREVEKLLKEPVEGESEYFGLRPGDRVSFTGLLELGRDNWESRATAAGLSVGGVTRTSAVVVSANPDSMSGKARSARQHRVPIIDEPTFARLLHQLEESPGRGVIPVATTTENSWHVELFPWSTEPSQDVRTVEDLTAVWIRDHAQQPLYLLSSRLDRKVLPEGLNPAGQLAVRWLKYFPEPLTATLEELGDLPGIGNTRLRKVVSATILAALDAPDLLDYQLNAPIYADDDLEAAPFTLEGSRVETTKIRGSSETALSTLAAWWWLVEGRSPIPHGQTPMLVENALETLAEDPFWLDPAAMAVAQSRDEISATIGSDDRDIGIFRDRLLGDSTLDELGSTHGVTRERIRQLEVQLKARLAQPHLITDLVVQALPRRFGVLALRADVLATLPSLGEEGPILGRNMLRTLELMSSEWELSGGWFQEVGFAAKLDDALARLADDYGVIQLDDMVSFLGIDVELLQQRLHEFPTSALLLLGDHILTQVGSYGKRGAAVLSIAGEPLSAEEIFSQLGTGNIRSMSNALAIDDRITRIGREQWALKEWGHEAYTTLAEWIAKRVDEAGSVSINELIEDATNSLGVSASSVRSYVSTAEFDVNGGMVTRAEEITTEWADPAEVADLFLSENGWVLLTTVNFDHMRGSGFGVPKGVATILEITWLQKRLMESPLGEQVVSHTRSGVSIGSIRRFLQEIDAQEGDRIWISFSRDGYFNVHPAVSRREGLTGMAEVLNILGLEGQISPIDSQAMGRLNEAIGLEPGAPRRKTVSRFRHRRQDDLADLIAEL